jgi:hypothetical protein
LKGWRDWRRRLLCLRQLSVAYAFLQKPIYQIGDGGAVNR